MVVLSFNADELGVPLISHTDGPSRHPPFFWSGPAFVRESGTFEEAVKVERGNCRCATKTFEVLTSSTGSIKMPHSTAANVVSDFLGHI